jgi:hypothetical protein
MKVSVEIVLINPLTIFLFSTVLHRVTISFEAQMSNYPNLCDIVC